MPNSISSSPASTCSAKLGMGEINEKVWQIEAGEMDGWLDDKTAAKLTAELKNRMVEG